MIGSPAENVCLVCGDDIPDSENGKYSTHSVHLPLTSLKLVAGSEERVGQIQLEELDDGDERIKEVDVWRPSMW